MTTLQATHTIRVLCVDDHSLVRKGISSILANERDIQLVGEAPNGRVAVELFRKHQPDVTLMDLRMPEVDGIEATRMIRHDFPEAKIIALTSFDGDQDIYRRWKRACAAICSRRWCIPKCSTPFASSTPARRLLPQEVSDRSSGYFPQVVLTPREVEVLTLVAQGLANKEIAARLGTASGTVKMHVQKFWPSSTPRTAPTP